MLERHDLTAISTQLFGGRAYEALPCGYVAMHSGLSCKLGAVAHMEVSGYTGLTSYHTLRSYLGGAGHAALCGHHGIGAYLHVVSYLDEIVELGTVVNACAAHCGAIYRGIGAYLYIVAYLYYTYLRNLGITAVTVGREAKAVGTNHCARMEDAALADAAPGIYSRSSIESCIIAYRGIGAYKRLRINLGIRTYTRPGAYVGKRSDISTITNLGCWVDIRWLLYSVPALCLHALGESQKVSYSGVGIFDTYEGSRDGSLGLEIFANEHCARVCLIDIWGIFGIGKKRERSFAPFFYLGKFTDSDFSVTFYDAGNHFSYLISCKFHLQWV